MNSERLKKKKYKAYTESHQFMERRYTSMMLTGPEDGRIAQAIDWNMQPYLDYSMDKNRRWELLANIYEFPKGPKSRVDSTCLRQLPGQNKPNPIICQLDPFFPRKLRILRSLPLFEDPYKAEEETNECIPSIVGSKINSEGRIQQRRQQHRDHHRPNGEKSNRLTHERCNREDPQRTVMIITPPDVFKKTRYHEWKKFGDICSYPTRRRPQRVPISRLTRSDILEGLYSDDPEITDFESDMGEEEEEAEGLMFDRSIYAGRMERLFVEDAPDKQTEDGPCSVESDDWDEAEIFTKNVNEEPIDSSNRDATLVALRSNDYVSTNCESETKGETVAIEWPESEEWIEHPITDDQCNESSEGQRSSSPIPCDWILVESTDLES